MPVFSYKAQNSSGQSTKGTFNASNNNEVYKMLKEQGYYPLEIVEGGNLTAIKNSTKTKIKKFSLKDLVVFCKQTAAILKAGVPILRAIDLLRKQASKKSNRLVLDNLFDGIQKGLPLSEAMNAQKDVFPVILLNMIEAGESTGNLEGAFERMSVHFEKELKLNQKLKKATTYPSIMVVVCLIAVTVLLIVVIPKFAAIFADAGMKLPLSTRILIGLEEFLIKFWYYIIPSIFGMIIGFNKFKKTPYGRRKMDTFYLKIPAVATLIQNAAAEKFCRTVSSMLSAGVSLINALEQVRKVAGNSLIEDALAIVKDDVAKGRTLSESISKVKYFPVMVSQMIKVGEESGSLDGMLERTSDYYENEVENAVNVLTTLLEPAIIMIMAVIIGFILISILSPMFDLGKAFG